MRVIEITTGIGSYCGRLLADLGADVIKVESPAASVQRDGFGLYTDAGKRSVALDLDGEDGRREFRRLVVSAELVIESTALNELESFGLGFESMRREQPRLVWTSITGFGRSGPQAGHATADIVAAALGGAMYATGDPADPPVALAGNQSWVATSACAAAASLIALHEARRSGRGQKVDVSALETVAAVTHICGAAKFLDDGIVPRRFGTGLFASVPSGAYRCRDGGLIYLMVNRPSHWQALARWVNEVTGNAEILDPMFDGPSAHRQPHRQLIDIFLAELFARLQASEACAEGQSRHLAITPVNGALDVLADQHLAARGFFLERRDADGRCVRVPGAPYRLSRTPLRTSAFTPNPGQHTDEVLQDLAARVGAAAENGRGEVERPRAAGALADLRVVELSAGMAGPWIGRFMAYCGADVIKVESRGHPDVTRSYLSPRAPEKGLQEAASPWFTDWNAGKRFVALDLTHPGARALCTRLVAVSDVVIGNYAAGVLDKLGLGYASLSAIKPDLVMLSSTGLGDSGPRRGYVTWGPNIEALSGLATLSGFEHRECTITQYAYPDALSALHGLTAVMAALAYRDRSGQGQYIDLSQYEATVASLGHLWLRFDGEPPLERRMGNASPSFAPHGVYRCRGEDRWCAIAVTADALWARLCAIIGRPELAEREGYATMSSRFHHREEIDGEIERWTRARDAYEVMAACQREGIAAGVVQNIEDQLRRDVQLAAREFFETIRRHDGGSVVANGIPLRFSETPGRTTDTGKPIGADNAQVFAGLLGLGAAEIEELTVAGAIQP